ncbi:MAG: toll/interleukin-1 receptor domain-containing protein [Anaerolineae bacterium]|nr:toll/interleukin-1 receptor domain-containing protein [Anaerolineae bacterium]
MPPLVFIGYSSKDEPEKNELVSHLGVLQNLGLIEIWSEDQITAGADRQREIDRAISRAKIAVLLITANFLNTVGENERLLQQLRRCHRQGLMVFTVIAKPCAWKSVAWLTSTRIRPMGEQPIWRDGGQHADGHLAAIAEEIQSIVTTIGQPDPIDLPFLIAAMTRSEATDLFTQDILAHNPEVTPGEVKRFEAFKAALFDYYTLDDLLKQYASQRTNWKPPINARVTIKKTVLEAIQNIDDYHPDAPRLEPDFTLSKKLFHPATRQQVLKQLDRSAAVLLVDAISMFHPTLKQALSSGIATHKHVAIMVLSPLNTRKFKLSRLIEETINRQMPTAVTRFDQFEPLSQTFGLNDSRVLHYQLFNTLPQTADLQAQLRLSTNLKRLGRGQDQAARPKGPVDFWSIGESS